MEHHFQSRSGAVRGDYVLNYLAHVSGEGSLREIARRRGLHPSTVMRQIRRVEENRDDQEFDQILQRLERRIAKNGYVPQCVKELMTMSHANSQINRDVEPETAREARRILRRLLETGAFLIAAPDLDKAAVLRMDSDGQTRQIAVTTREFAQRFVELDWTQATKQGRVVRYQITDSGRAALERILAQDRAAKREKRGAAEKAEDTADVFRAQHQSMVEKVLHEEDGARTIRFNLAESPLTLLARRKGPDGNPFLSRDELDAGERLRLEFERAHMGPRVTQNWDKFGLPRTRGAFHPTDPSSDGAIRARENVNAAMSALGTGLSDIALRCCCFLEGLEAAERRLGWSARSGKVVLKIALKRLADHYEDQEKKEKMSENL